MNDEKMNSNSVEAEYMDINNRNAWRIVYQKIERECQCQSQAFTYIEAKKPQNKHLNRYRDVNPYDHSRVILKRCDQDYINANLVKMDRAKRKYILTQGPLSTTVGHFWLMVWEQNSRAILMLNKIIEKNEIKCHCYWPQGVGEQYKMVLDDVKLTVEQLNEEDFGHYSTRLFKLFDMETSESREVIQFHYTTWPDFGVPSSPVAFLQFLNKVRSSGALEPDVGPAVVHCSAGIGRSGTFCLVDSCLVIIEKEGENVNVQQILLELRKDRMGLIQTPDQLKFSYKAIIEGAKRFHPDWVYQWVFRKPIYELYSWLGHKDGDGLTTCHVIPKISSVLLEQYALMDFEERRKKMDESIYSTVAEDAEEETPPLPPPRGESLARAPARPLPAIPSSASLGNLNYTTSRDSSSNEGSPIPPTQESPSSASSADDEDDDPVTPHDSGETETLRRRRNRDLGERVSAMKRRARDAERWQSLKRSLYKPLTITFGFVIAGVLIYKYFKN